MRLSKFILSLFMTFSTMLFTTTSISFTVQGMGTQPGYGVDGSPGTDVPYSPRPQNEAPSSRPAPEGPSVEAELTQFSVPVTPNNLLKDPVGRVWFSSFDANVVGYLDPANRRATIYPRKADTGNVWAIKRDASGSLWYTTVNAEPVDAIGRLDPATATLTEWSVPNTGRYFGLEIHPTTGEIWFALDSGVGKLNPSTHTITSWSSLPYELTYDLDISADGKIWVSLQPGLKQGLLRLDPAGSAITVWEFPSPDSRPFRLVASGSNEIWLTEMSASGNSLAVFLPSTNTLREYKLPVPGSAPMGIDKHTGSIWFTAPGANSIGQFQISASVPTTTTVLSPISLPFSPTDQAAAHGSETVTPQISTSTVTTAEVTSTVSDPFTLYDLPPGSGAFSLVIESSGTVWFTAPYIGKLVIDLKDEVYLPYISR